MATEFFGGIDIGGTNIKAAVVDSTGVICEEFSIPTKADGGPEEMVPDIVELAQKLRTYSVTALGVGFPSVVTPGTGVVNYPPNLKGWGIVPLRDILERVLEMPVIVDNDANIGAYGEAAVGAGVGWPDFLYLTLGTGVGGGIISGGRIFRGVRGGAGEVGHIYVDVPLLLRERTSPRAKLEDLVGRRGIIAIAESQRMTRPSLLRTKDDIDVLDISLAADRGDEAALQTFVTAGTILGIGIAGVCNVLDMSRIVVGGGISRAHASLLESFEKALCTYSLPTVAPYVEVRRAAFLGSAGVIGAAMAARDMMDGKLD
jgi:glucokinase